MRGAVTSFRIGGAAGAFAGAVLLDASLLGSTLLPGPIDAGRRFVFEAPQVFFDPTAGSPTPDLVLGPVQLAGDGVRRLAQPAIGRIKAGADQRHDDELGHGVPSA